MTDVLKLAERFVAAIETGDFETMRACYAPHAVIWHNTDGLENPGQDRDANVKVLAWMRRRLTAYRYDIIRREATRDGFFQQHVLRGTTTAGEPFALAAAIICKVENGQITRLDEYIREADAEPLSRAPAASKT